MMTAQIITIQETNTLSTERQNAETALVTWLLNIDSDNTRIAYQQAWTAFIAHTGIQHPYDVTYEDVSVYRDHLTTVISERTGRALSQCTINQKISAISSFYAHAKEHKYFSGDNPCDGIKRKAVNPYGKATKLKDDSDSGNEVIMFLSQIDRETLQGKRDYAIMKLMIVTGVRVSVITTARVDDIVKAGSDYFLQYKNKGGGTKRAKITGVINEIALYLSERGITGINCNEPLFVATPRGKRVMKQTGHNDGKDKPLSGTSINNLVKKYAGQAGLSGIHPHSLRHTAGYLMRNEPLAEIQSFFGHTDPRITLVYLTSMNNSSGDKLTDKIAGQIDSAMECLL